jgi:hypothetical protein
MQASGGVPARTDDRESNEIQGILIKSVEMQMILYLRLLNEKDLIEAVEIQKILHLKRPNAKSLAAFATYTPKIFSILCACADSNPKVPAYTQDLECKRFCICGSQHPQIGDSGFEPAHAHKIENILGVSGFGALQF